MATRMIDTSAHSAEHSQPEGIQSLIGREQYFNDVTFICHLCNNTVNRATFLSCLHSFCKQCINDKLQTDTHSMLCPLCPSSEDQSVELQSNPLPELISKLKQLKSVVRDETKSLECTDCVFGVEGKPAVAYCVECNATICQIDMKSHEKYNIGHLMLELNQLQGSTVQEIIKRLQTPKQGIGGIRERRDPESVQEAATPLTASSVEIEDACILEARSRISQLEERKSDLEKEWNNQVAETVEFFQQLHTKLEAHQTAVLEELSQLYQPLMTPLQEAIGQLEQTVTYTGYVGMLGRYSRVAGISEKPTEKMQDISILLANFTTPSDAYSVEVEQQDQHTVQDSVNAFLTLQNVPKPSDPPGKISKIFANKKKTSHKLWKEITRTKYTTPLDAAFNSTTNILYVLFDCYWKTYQQLHNSLVERQTVEIKDPTSIPINSSIALLTNSVYIMANHIVYEYSDAGEYRNQLQQIQTQIGAIFPNPKIYTFTGLNMIYLASLQSSQVYMVDSVDGSNQGSVNLTSYGQNMPGNTGYNNFVDMVRSPIQNNQLLILYSMYRPQNPPNHETTNNQYSIQVHNIQNMQFCGSYSLSQQMSPFCCLTAHDKSLYVLDVSTGSAHLYDFNELQNNHQYNQYGYGGYFGNSTTYFLWNQKSITENSVPKSTKLDGKEPRNEMIRAFSNQHFKNQVLLLSGGRIHFIS